MADSHGHQLQQLFKKQSIFNLKPDISPGATFKYVFSLLKLHFSSFIDAVVITVGANVVDECGFINQSFFCTHLVIKVGKNFVSSGKNRSKLFPG